MHIFLFFKFIMVFTAQVLKVCRTLGPTVCLKLLQKVCLKGGDIIALYTIIVYTIILHLIEVYIMYI